MSRAADSGDSVRPVVFLDRDGVLNAAFIRDGVPIPPQELAQFRLLPGVAEACQQLHDAGYLLIVVTNQPDIARGSTTREAVDQLNARLLELVPSIDEVIVCPHDSSDECSCRKPQPGMLLEAAARLGLDLSWTVLVGDRWRDIEAAQRAGVHSIHIQWDYLEKQPDHPDFTARSLLGSVAHIRQFLDRAPQRLDA